MTYDEAITFWYDRTNFEVRSAMPGDLKLERMRALLRLLGDPHERVRLVHVTGTKGKGSTCAMLASILRSAGYRVGLFTSPHLEHVEERIQVDRLPISPAELAARMEEVAAAVRVLERAGAGAGITFFEIGTALGFLHFYYRRCDVAAIEVGLGGRFDSTNVCHPLVSVITNIGLDHTAQLGHTIEEIAFQKAGIIKRGVPVVSGVKQDGARAIIRRIANEQGAPLWEADSATKVERLGLLGRHQAENAAVARLAIERLRATGMPIPDLAMARGLADVRWPARIECISKRPVVILDSAHNVPSIEALVQTLRDSFPVAGVKRLVFAVSSDKDYSAMLQVLAGYFDHFHLTRYGNNPRSVAPEQLAAVLAKLSPQKPQTIHESSSAAWLAARSASKSEDLICITGSFFLAGELRRMLVPISG
jgi:dihydrofolate synthase/folylpolyglutamate synthase